MGSTGRDKHAGQIVPAALGQAVGRLILNEAMVSDPSDEQRIEVVASSHCASMATTADTVTNASHQVDGDNPFVLMDNTQQ
jgi:hypothetical protein